MLANTIIKAALRSVLIKSGSFTPSAQQYADGLEVLNDGMNMWSAQNNMVYEDTLESLSIPSGTQSITIGATGTLVTARPLEITVATLKSGSNEYPLSIEDSGFVHDITSIGQPYAVYYRNTFPNGTLYFDKTTDQAYTLDLTSIKYLANFADGTTDNPLPPHYEAALKHNLKLWLCDEMGRQPTQLMIEQAAESKKTIIGQALNIVPSSVEISLRSGYSIESE